MNRIGKYIAGLIVMAGVILSAGYSFANEQATVTDSLQFGSIEIQSTQPGERYFDAIRQEYVKKAVSEDNYKVLSDNLLRIPPRQGYHFPMLLLESVQPSVGADGRYLNPRLRLDWGEITRIDTIIFQGVVKTKNQVLNRTVKPRYGTIYTKRQEQQIIRSLRRFPYLTVNQANEIVQTKDGQMGILVSIRELQDNEFIGVAGYVPETYNSKGYFTGELDLKFHNLSGTGRQLYLYWSKTNRYSQQMKLNYMEPWIWKTNLYGIANFEQMLRDTLVVIRNFGIGSGFYSTKFGSMELTLNRESTIPTPGGRELLGLFNTRTDAAGLNYSIDRRDNVYNPSRGYLINTGFAAGIQKRDSLETITRSEIQLESAGFIPLKKELIIAVKMNARAKWLSGEEPGYAEQFWFGGAGNLRGYPNDFFRGSRIAWGSLELRRLIGELSSFYLFFRSGLLSPGRGRNNNLRLSLQLRNRYPPRVADGHYRA
ncbi:MAG: BamA/TamA family outer membrane protein [Candidatus Marinimicrobia bacterium]|nr:BamA/TamA family outer membrane protein [Candidatus Neomarinimicrobiota bacterium]